MDLKLYHPSTALAREKRNLCPLHKVASGRRHPLTLGDILAFATGAAEEPPLGFEMTPSIVFTTGVESIKVRPKLFNHLKL